MAPPKRSLWVLSWMDVWKKIRQIWEIFHLTCRVSRSIYVYLYTVYCGEKWIWYFYFLKMAVTVWEVAVFHRRCKSMHSQLSSVFLTTCQVTTTLDLSSCCVETSKTVRKSLWWCVTYRKICIESHQEGQAWFERHLHLHLCIISFTTPPTPHLFSFSKWWLYI